MKKNRLYLFASIVCFLGLIWLFWGVHFFGNRSVCLIKNITGFPCPSCGSTRSIQNLLNGEILKAILINPLGPIIAAGSVMTITLLLIDLIFKKRYFIQVFDYIERVLKTNKLISISLITLMLINWLWNISKGL